MENKDSIDSNKVSMSDKLKKPGIKKLILVIAVLTISLLMLLVLVNKHNVNKYSFSFKGLDIYCESIHTKPFSNKKEVYCDMVAENNGDMTIYLRRDYGQDIVVEPGAKERFTLKWYKGDIEIFNAKVPPSLACGYREMQQRREHRMYTLHYIVEHDGFTYVWKPDTY